MNSRPHKSAAPAIVGLGGTAKRPSTTEVALQLCLMHAETRGAQTRLFGGNVLSSLPLYSPNLHDRTPEAQEIVNALREADGIVLASPSYHGGISGAVKNVLDYLEDLRSDERSYLDGRAVGCIVTGDGSQGSTTALMSLRSIVHALRGWPTPFGAVIDSTLRPFDDAGACTDTRTADAIALVARQVVEFSSVERPSVRA